MRRLVYAAIALVVAAAMVYGAMLFPQVAARDIVRACKQEKRFTVGSESFSCRLEQSP